MKFFQDDCLSVGQYAHKIGKSRRTVQRYISMGMPTVNGTKQSIHLPTVNQWWLTQIKGKTKIMEGYND